MMTPVATAILPLLLAGAAGSVEWLDETTIAVTANVKVRDPSQAFNRGGAQLEKLANKACRKIGKAQQQGQPTLSAMGISRGERERMVALRATFSCVAK
jgi:hypothetical protein